MFINVVWTHACVFSWRHIVTLERGVHRLAGILVLPTAQCTSARIQTTICYYNGHYILLCNGCSSPLPCLQDSSAVKLNFLGRENTIKCAEALKDKNMQDLRFILLVKPPGGELERWLRLSAPTTDWMGDIVHKNLLPVTTQGRITTIRDCVTSLNQSCSGWSGVGKTKQHPSKNLCTQPLNR